MNYFKPLNSRKIEPKLDATSKFKNTWEIISNISTWNHTKKRCNVKVVFKEGFSIQEATNELNQLSSPQIIIWFIGCYGLRESGLEYYKDNLISPILKKNASATFWLIDLTAWNAFKKPQGSIDRENSCCGKIDSFKDHRIKCIRSSTIFQKMQNLENSVVSHFKKSLQRDFILETSRNYPILNIRVADIFSSNCSVMESWYNYDVSRAYSLFQYLEGCLLIDEIFYQMKILNNSKNLQIAFALPNDETRYYKDELNSFENDINFLITKRCEDLNITDINLTIIFICFKYGSQIQHRPYNAPGKVLKRNELTFNLITGI